MTTRFSLARWLNVRQHLDKYWAETEVNPPDTLILHEDERLAAAEAEWFSEGMDTPPVPSPQRS